MNERPIVFSTEMVQAILDGRKTQTRRVIKPQPINAQCGLITSDGTVLFFEGTSPESRGCANGLHHPKFGKIGDHLWVREAWCLDIEDPYVIPKTQPLGVEIFYRADGEILMGDQICTSVWKPSIFMPRWASRITLEITDIRVERVQAISADDVIAEGIPPYTLARGCLAQPPDDPRWKFIELWDSINKKRGYGWDSNPWVWVIEFKKVEA